MTSALFSLVVYAIELLELPNEIPIVCLSAGDAPLVVVLSPAILFKLSVDRMCEVPRPADVALCLLPTEQFRVGNLSWGTFIQFWVESRNLF